MLYGVHNPPQSCELIGCEMIWPLPSYMLYGVHNPPQVSVSGPSVVTASFPSACCWTFLCIFTGFPPFLRLCHRPTNPPQVSVEGLSVVTASQGGTVELRCFSEVV